MAGTESLRIVQLSDSRMDTPGGVPSYMATLDEYFTTEGHQSMRVVGETTVQDPTIISLGKTFPMHLNGTRVDVPFPTPPEQVHAVLEATRPDVLHPGLTYFPTTGGRFIDAVPDRKS